MAPPLAFLAHLSPADPVPDAELLRRHAAGDPAAFELLVRRHAALVWRVCRSQLADEHAAEDAFQASFLALARNGNRVKSASAAGWLATVARHAASRRRRKPFAPLPPDLAAPPAGDSGEVLAEVDRLPARLREPVLLCLVEGCSHAEAAARLNLPIGTVSSRLSRAKGDLRRRLAALAPSVAPATAVKAALSLPSPAVVSLASGVLSAMSTAFRLKVAASLALAVGAVALTVSASQAPKPTPPDDLAKLQGEWTVVSIQENGKSTTPADVKGMSWTFGKDAITARDPGDKSARVPFTLDQAKSPPWIDLTLPTGDGKTQPAVGIYKLAGDRLKLALRDPDPAKRLGRPTEFAVDGEAGVIEFVRAGTNPPPAKPEPVKPPAPVPAELAKLQGKWRVVRTSVHDMEIRPTDGRTLAIAGDVVSQQPGDTARVRMVLDPSHTPARIDLTPLPGGPAGADAGPLRGIYKLDGDRLLMCVRPAADADRVGRPTEFAVGGGAVVTEMVRAGSPADGPLPADSPLVGEWQQPCRGEKPDDTLMVWTFRDTGVCRTDFLDKASGQVNVGAFAGGLSVGRWRLDGNELVVETEGYVGDKKRPHRTVERLPVEALTADKLVVRRLADPRGTKWVTLSFTRFPGWDKQL